MKTTDIYNKVDRRRLTERWMNTETSLEEERMLAGYYRNNRPDEDEEDVAALILAMQDMEVEAPTFGEGAEEEYDRILKRHSSKKRRHRMTLITTGIAAAAAVILTLVLTVTSDNTVVPVQKTAVAEKPETIRNEDKTIEVDIKETNTLASVTSTKAAGTSRHAATQRPPSGDHGEASALSMEDLLEFMEAVETIGLGQDESYEIVPAGNTVLVRLNNSDETTTTFMAVKSEDSGSVRLVSM